jgi:hypothetical protein
MATITSVIICSFLFSSLCNFSLAGKSSHGAHTFFSGPQIANPQILGFVPLSQIRKFLRCGSPQIRKFAMFNLEITNPQKDRK